MFSIKIIFIDPNNCRNYISCVTEANKTADIYRCPPGHEYNSKDRVCVSAAERNSTEETSCSTVVCPQTNFTFVPYAPNPAYYVYCTDTEKVMFRCADEINQVYDVDSGTCKYKCIKSGSFEDREHCTNYYVCSDSEKTGQLTAVNIKCSDG